MSTAEFHLSPQNSSRVLRSQIGSSATTSYVYSTNSDDRLVAVSAETSVLVQSGLGSQSNWWRAFSVVAFLANGPVLLVAPHYVSTIGVVPWVVVCVALACVSVVTLDIVRRLTRAHGYDSSSLLLQCGNAVFCAANIVSALMSAGAAALFQIYLCDAILFLIDTDRNNEMYRLLVTAATALCFLLVALLTPMQQLLRSSLASTLAAAMMVTSLCVALLLCGKAIQQLATDGFGGSSGTIIRSTAESEHHGSAHGGHVAAAVWGWASLSALIKAISAACLTFSVHDVIDTALRASNRPRLNIQITRALVLAAAVAVAAPSILLVLANSFTPKVVSGATVSVVELPSNAISLLGSPLSSIGHCIVLVWALGSCPLLFDKCRAKWLDVVGAGGVYGSFVHMLMNGGTVVLASVPSACSVSPDIVAAITGAIAWLWLVPLPLSLWWWWWQMSSATATGLDDDITPETTNPRTAVATNLRNLPLWCTLLPAVFIALLGVGFVAVLIVAVTSSALDV